MGKETLLEKMQPQLDFPEQCADCPVRAFYESCVDVDMDRMGPNQGGEVLLYARNLSNLAIKASREPCTGIRPVTGMRRVLKALGKYDPRDFENCPTN